MSGVFDFCSKSERDGCERARKDVRKYEHTHARCGWMIASILVGKGGGGSARVGGGKIEVVTLERDAFLKRPPGSSLLSLDSSSSSSLDFSSRTRLWILPERH